MHTIEQNTFINHSYYLPGNNEIILWRIIGKIVIIIIIKIKLLYFFVIAQDVVYWSVDPMANPEKK